MLLQTAIEGYVKINTKILQIILFYLNYLPKSVSIF